MHSRALMLVCSAIAAGLVTGCSDSGDGAVDDALPAVVDVVALGGSNVGGLGIGGADEAYPATYARSLGAEAGVETRLTAHHTLETMRIRTLSAWNDLLRADEQLRSDLEAAEVVIVEIGIQTILIECGVTTGWTAECLKDVASTMSGEYEELFGAIEELVADGTVVMAFNQGLPRPAGRLWRDHPDWPEMKVGAFEVWWDGLDAAASAHNASVIDTARMFGDGDPDEFGIGPEYTQQDEIHLNPVGHRLWADLLLEADGIGPA